MRQQIIDEALTWVGTPFQWQASRKGVACDCKGLIAGVARELGMEEAASLYANMRHYREVDCDLLREGLSALFDEIEPSAMLPGDVLQLNMDGKPRHLAILCHGKIVHQYGRGFGRVAATYLEPSLRRWPLHSVWRWRGID